MPDAPAAIRAVFAEWRMVKTRKVLALIFEVPLEQQGEVLTMLGAPMPDAEIWCGIARLNTASPAMAERPGRKGPDDNPHEGTVGAISPASQRGKERYTNSTQREQALVRAALLPGDDRFRAWVASERAGGGARRMYAVTEHEAAEYIRHKCCDGGSRKLIAEDDECWRRFTELEMAYKMTTGQMAEVR